MTLTGQPWRTPVPVLLGRFLAALNGAGVLRRLLLSWVQRFESRLHHAPATQEAWLSLISQNRACSLAAHLLAQSGQLSLGHDSVPKLAHFIPVKTRFLAVSAVAAMHRGAEPQTPMH